MHYHRQQGCRRTSVRSAVTHIDGRFRNEVKENWPQKGVKATIISRANRDGIRGRIKKKIRQFVA